MDRSMQAKKAAVEQRISDLDNRREALYEEMETVKHQRERAVDELRAVEQAIKLATPTEGATVVTAVRKLGSFTLPELISALRSVPSSRVRLHVKRLLDDGTIEPAGKVMGKAMYEFKAPTDAGSAFERQQERRKLEESELVEFVRSGGRAVPGTGNTLSQISDAEVRKAVRDAIADGWALEKIGGTHFRLSRGKRHVTVPSTPRNSDGAARTIRHHTRRGGGRPRAGAAA